MMRDPARLRGLRTSSELVGMSGPDGHGEQPHTEWSEEYTGRVVVAVLVMFAITAFTILSLSYIFVMWRIRHNFFIAMRSPLLACGCGFCLCLRGWSATLEYVVAWGGRAPTDDGIVDLVGLPMVLCAEALAIMRAFRVVLMYYPHRRKSWGRIPKERVILRATLWAYVLMEILVWSAAVAFGIPRAGDATSSIMAPVAVMVALVAGFWIGCQLRKVDDMCSVSTESLKIGGFMIGAAGLYAILLLVPMQPLAFKYAHVVYAAVSYSPVIWIVNVEPVREMLSQKYGCTNSTLGGFFLVYGIIPWRSTAKASRTVVPSTGTHRSLVHPQICSDAYLGTPLDDIMSFLPLREAFGEFCRKALCSESFQFLVDVLEFKHSVYAVEEVGGKSEDAAGKGFQGYLTIVQEFVEPDARSEVNIDSNAKRAALLYTGQDEYNSLGLDQRAEIFLLAEREISQLLAENLVTKFRASAAYKELVDDEELHQG